MNATAPATAPAPVLPTAPAAPAVGRPTVFTVEQVDVLGQVSAAATCGSFADAALAAERMLARVPAVLGDDSPVTVRVATLEAGAAVPVAYATRGQVTAVFDDPSDAGWRYAAVLDDASVMVADDAGAVCHLPVGHAATAGTPVAFAALPAGVRHRIGRRLPLRWTTA